MGEYAYFEYEYAADLAAEIERLDRLLLLRRISYSEHARQCLWLWLEAEENWIDDIVARLLAGQ